MHDELQILEINWKPKAQGGPTRMLLDVKVTRNTDDRNHAHQHIATESDLLNISIDDQMNMC